MAIDHQSAGIVFGDWKLVPVDARNWELCHRHMSRPTGNHGGGTVKWHRLGRYYSYNTVTEAMRYAIDCEMKDKHKERAAEIGAAIKEYEGITGRMVDAVTRALGKE